MTQCASCGSEITDGGICPTCDATVVEPVTPPPTMPRPSRPSETRTDYFTSPADGRFVPGTVIGERYRIVALLGKGGMGEVYRANDLTLGQPVALKFLPESMTRDPDALTRFHNEVRIARQVSHPNVCRVYDLGEVDGRPYIFDGVRRRRGSRVAAAPHRTSARRQGARNLRASMCAGLAAAHDKGVLHRDLKPANIMLDRRGTGLHHRFRPGRGHRRTTGIEARSGTPAYMAPEQLAGKEVTASERYLLARAGALRDVQRASGRSRPTRCADLIRLRSKLRRSA